jgi:hypothetical protein
LLSIRPVHATPKPIELVRVSFKLSKLAPILKNLSTIYEISDNMISQFALGTRTYASIDLKRESLMYRALKLFGKKPAVDNIKLLLNVSTTLTTATISLNVYND